MCFILFLFWFGTIYNVSNIYGILMNIGGEVQITVGQVYIIMISLND